MKNIKPLSNYRQHAQKALEAAKYHEGLAFSFAHPEKGNYDQAVAHIRSYYWELYSVWDYIIQSVNEQTLGLKKERVREDFIEKLKKKAPDYPYVNILEEIYKNKSIARIKQLRNYAHKWVMDPNLVEIDEDNKVSVIVFNPNQESGLSSQINIDRNDLWFMTEAFKIVTDKGIL